MRQDIPLSKSRQLLLPLVRGLSIVGFLNLDYDSDLKTVGGRVL